MKTDGLTIQMTVIEQYFPVVWGFCRYPSAVVSCKPPYLNIFYKEVSENGGMS